MQNARIRTASMIFARSDIVENKLMSTKTCFVGVLMMPGTRESVQGDRFCADLKLSTLPWTGRRSLTREALKAASTAIRSLPAYSPAEIEKLTCYGGLAPIL